MRVAKPKTELEPYASDRSKQASSFVFINSIYLHKIRSHDEHALVACSSRRKPRNDSCIQLYQWIHYTVKM
jgi:hypothetical protein